MQPRLRPRPPLRSIVTAKLCSPVVPSLPDGADRHEGVLGRPGLVVVRVVAEHVRGRVNEPREVEHHAIPERSGHPETVPKVLPPPVLRNEGR